MGFRSRLGRVWITMLALIVITGCLATSRQSADTPGEADLLIENKIMRAIQASPSLKDQDIQVTSRDGAVTLNGVVESAIERTMAVRLAERTEGVVSVQNNLTTH